MDQVTTPEERDNIPLRNPTQRPPLIPTPIAGEGSGGDRENGLTCKNLHLCCSHTEGSPCLSLCLELSLEAGPRRTAGPHRERAPGDGEGDCASVLEELYIYMVNGYHSI